MSVEVLMNVTPTESRVVLVENGILQEVHIERQVKRGLVGNIYMGKISRVLPVSTVTPLSVTNDPSRILPRWCIRVSILWCKWLKIR